MANRSRLQVEPAMGRKLPPLNAVKAFEAAARHLNFSKAAQELCVTQGAISRQIQVLEKHFGIQLFQRAGRSLEITEEGRVLFPSVRYALDELERATHRVNGADSTRILTVSTSPTLSVKWLFPRLPRFGEIRPDIEIRTISTVQPIDFSREDIDIAIRIGRFGATDSIAGPRINFTQAGDSRGIRAVRLIGDTPVPVCSPAFLKRYGPFRSLADIGEDRLIHMASRPNAWSERLRFSGFAVLPQPKHVHGHFFLGIEAAIRGDGVALVPHVLVRDDIEAGRLTILPDPGGVSTGAYYLLARASQWTMPKIAAFRRWITAESKAWIADNPIDGGVKSAPRTYRL